MDVSPAFSDRTRYSDEMKITDALRLRIQKIDSGSSRAHIVLGARQVDGGDSLLSNDCRSAAEVEEQAEPADPSTRRNQVGAKHRLDWRDGCTTKKEIDGVLCDTDTATLVAQQSNETPEDDLDLSWLIWESTSLYKSVTWRFFVVYHKQDIFFGNSTFKLLKKTEAMDLFESLPHTLDFDEVFDES
jgi:hypothetical protein